MGGSSDRWRWVGPWAASVAAFSALVAGLAAMQEEPPLPPAVHDGALLVLDREALARVDLRLVHEELVPGWVVASGGVKGLHFDRLRREAGKDPNLGALLDRIEVLVAADPVLNAQELLAIVRAWNEYLAKAGEPWRLSGEVQVDGRGGRWVMKCYRVLFDAGKVAVGERAYRAEVRRRVDDISQPDVWLGHMHDHTDGVVVLLDRITAFTLDKVWPMLDPVLEAELDPLSRAFAPAVRAEVAAALSSDHVAALAATAEDRMWLLRAAESVHARHQCGSAFVVARVPWNGLSSRDLATLQLHVSEGAPCPDVTEHEVLVFSARSWHLRQTEGLREGLEELVGFVAGSVVVHEARHAADDDALAGQRIPCIGCPPETSHVGALEGSAYLASFADPQHGQLALYQACGLDPELVPERAAMVRFLAERLGGSCEAPPGDLAARARDLEVAIFGRTEPIALADFPAALPVSSEYPQP